METVIECKNVSFSYLDYQAQAGNGGGVLRDIDLSLNTGKMLGVLGANGSGKSTLLKILSGVLAPKAGVVAYRGKELSSLNKRDVSKRVAYIPQNPAFAFHFTVSEVVLMGRAPYVGRFEFEREEDIAVANSVMEAVGIIHLKDRAINGVSGGERQLVSLARALAQEPDVMILDEPATFLDLRYRDKVMKTLSRLKERSNMAIIAATHDVFSDLFYFDEVIMLKDGRVFAKGETDQVINEKNLSVAYGVEVTVRKEDRAIFVVTN